MTDGIILTGNGRAYAPVQTAAGVTWKTQGTMLILRSSKNKTLGYVHKHYARAFTAAFRTNGKQYLLPKKFQTQEAAKAALVRWWTGIVRTEL